MIYWIRRFWGWLWGVHVCEEFTQWTLRVANYSRPTDWIDQLVDQSQTKIVFTRKWQERQCTVCGKIQQRVLKY